MSGVVALPPEDKFSVEVMIEGRVRWQGTVNLTRSEYVQWCDTIDSARGSEEEDVADSLIDLAGIDFMRDIEVEDLRVEEFCEIKPRKPVRKVGAK